MLEQVAHADVVLVHVGSCVDGADLKQKREESLFIRNFAAAIVAKDSMARMFICSLSL